MPGLSIWAHWHSFALSGRNLSLRVSNLGSSPVPCWMYESSTRRTELDFILDALYLASRSSYMGLNYDFRLINSWLWSSFSSLDFIFYVHSYFSSLRLCTTCLHIAWFASVGSSQASLCVSHLRYWSVQAGDIRVFVHISTVLLVPGDFQGALVMEVNNVVRCRRQRCNSYGLGMSIGCTDQCAIKTENSLLGTTSKSPWSMKAVCSSKMPGSVSRGMRPATNFATSLGDLQNDDMTHFREILIVVVQWPICSSWWWPVVRTSLQSTLSISFS